MNTVYAYEKYECCGEVGYCVISLHSNEHNAEIALENDRLNNIDDPAYGYRVRGGWTIDE